MKPSEVKKLVSAASAEVFAAKVKLTEAELARDTAANPGMSPGHELNVIAAQRELADKRIAFDQALPKAAYTLFVKGPFGESFANAVRAQVASVSVNFADLVQEIINPIRSNARDSLHFGTYEFGILKGLAAGWASMYMLPPPEMTMEAAIYVGDDAGQKVDETKLLNAVSDTLATLQPEFFKVLVQDLATSRAMDLQIDSPVVPVVIYNLSDMMRSRLESILFEGRYLVVDASEELSEEAVLKVLRQVKSNVSKE